MKHHVAATARNQTSVVEVMLLSLQSSEGKGSWMLHPVQSTKLFEEQPYLHSSLKKGQNIKSAGEVTQAIWSL